MTIVLRGIGRDIDSFTSQVAFGLTRENVESATVAEVVSTSVDQWYAVDYRQRRRRPVTDIEWKFLRNVFAAWKRGKAKTLRETREHRALMRKMAAGLVARERQSNAAQAGRQATNRNGGDVRPGVRAGNGRRKGTR